MANTKQISGPETFPGLSRNRPQETAGRLDPQPPQLKDLNAVIIIKGYLHFKKHLIEMSLSFNNPGSIY